MRKITFVKGVAPVPRAQRHFFRPHLEAFLMSKLVLGWCVGNPIMSTFQIYLYFLNRVDLTCQKLIFPQLVKGTTPRQKRRQNIDFLCVLSPFHLPVVQTKLRNVFFWNVFVIFHLVVVFIWPKSASNKGARPRELRP